jgi:hypothetical protein
MRFLREKDAAKFLEISYNNLKEKRRARLIRYFKIGNLVKYQETDLIQFLESRAVEPLSPLFERQRV